MPIRYVTAMQFGRHADGVFPVELLVVQVRVFVNLNGIVVVEPGDGRYGRAAESGESRVQIAHIAADARRGVPIPKDEIGEFDLERGALEGVADDDPRPRLERLVEIVAVEHYQVARHRAQRGDVDAVQHGAFERNALGLHVPVRPRRRKATLLPGTAVRVRRRIRIDRGRLLRPQPPGHEQRQPCKQAGNQ